MKIIENTDSNTELFNSLDKTLSEGVDIENLQDLEHWLGVVRKKSKALASSLNRCFASARKSMRYVIVYKLGMEDAFNKIDTKEENVEAYLENHLKEFFEKNDFMHYREYVRLLRACTIEVGGEATSHIKGMYNNFFRGKRLIAAYNHGRRKNLDPKDLNLKNEGN